MSMSRVGGAARSCEIAIVGASASGLFTACLLAREGRDVAVFERADTLAPASRALIVTSAMRDYLGDLGDGSIKSQIDRYELFANGKVGEVRLGRPDLIIERTRLVSDLAEEAESAGVRIHLGYRFLGIAPKGESCSLTLEKDGDPFSLEAKIVVGADGASSAVARAAGWPRQPTVPLLQAIVETPHDLPPDTSRVWFVPQDTPYFYWLIPEQPGRAALGVIGEQPMGLRHRFDGFLDKHGLKPLEYQGARIPRYARWTRVHRNVGEGDVYLVGDAAGHVKVSTVGGLVTGFRGAIGVVEAITGASSRRTLRGLRRELDAHLLVRKVVHGFGEAEYCQLLDLLNDSALKSLHRHTRDEATSILWKVALQQPRLLPLSIRGLLARAS